MGRRAVCESARAYAGVIAVPAAGNPLPAFRLMQPGQCYFEEAKSPHQAGLRVAMADLRVVSLAGLAAHRGKTKQAKSEQRRGRRFRDIVGLDEATKGEID